MDLDEWTWRRKVTLAQIQRDLGLCQATLSHVKNRRINPRLETALMLVKYSDGEIDLESLLPEMSKKNLELCPTLEKKCVAG